ncbi:MAG: zinc-dependent alcohol dehydrogenase family protein [Candidatus Thiodiazotropha sp.]
MTTPNTSRVVRFHQTGSADELKIEELPVAEPAQGEIRIKVEAIGLNRAEIMFREGQYLETPELPARLGYEAAGIVDQLGSDVTGLSIGDRVSTIPGFSLNQYGIYGESAIVPAASVAHYPENLTPGEGASIWMQYLTAYGALVEIGSADEDKTVLITAASSSVGLAAIQIANMMGAKCIATTRGADKKAFLLDAGADHVVVTDEEDLARSVMELTHGKGADIIFDPIGGPLLTQLADAAAPQGIIIEYGALAPDPAPYPLFPALAKSLSIRGYVLFEITTDPARLEIAKHFVYDGLESGALKPIIDRTFVLDDIVQAHRHMESNRQLGKIIVTV